MTIIPIAFVLGGFAIFLGLATLLFDMRRRKHRGVSQEEFIREFTRTGTPKQIPEAVYNFYTHSRFFRNLMIRPDDLLTHVLNEGEEDIEQDAILLMNKLSLKPPSEEARLRWNEQMRATRSKTSVPPTFSIDLGQPWPIQTIGDMVLWLDWVRQCQEPNK